MIQNASQEFSIYQSTGGSRINRSSGQRIRILSRGIRISGADQWVHL